MRTTIFDMVALALLLGVLLPNQADAGHWRELSKGLEAHAAAWGVAAPAPPVAAPSRLRAFPRYQETAPVADAGQPAAVIPVAPILNALWRSPITFQAGSVTVHVAGMKASNRDKDWFLMLCPEPCDKPIFKRGKDFLRYKAGFVQVLDRKATVSLNQTNYKITLDGQMRNKEQSKLKIEAESGGGRWVWEAGQIAEAVFGSGVPLRLRGQEFRLLYMDEILQGEDGNFGGFAGRRSFILMTREQGKFVAYPFRESDVPRDRPALLMRPPNGDPKAEGRPLNVGLMLDAQNRLVVYEAETLSRRK